MCNLKLVINEDLIVYRVRIDLIHTHRQLSTTNDSTLVILTALFFHVDKNAYIYTYRVVEAKLVSCRFSWPSKAIPRLSLLEESNGVRYITFCKHEPGSIGHPSLKIFMLIILRKNITYIIYLLSFHASYCSSILAILK